MIAIDVREEALIKAREVGATECLDGTQVSSIPEAIREITNGGAHVSVDALGSQKTCVDSIHCLRKQGRHIQVGLLMADQAEPKIPMHLVISKELSLVGSHGMQAHRYHEMFEMISAGKLEPQKLIGRTISLEEAPEELPAIGRFKSTGVTVIDQF